jgi:flagellin-like hook-associated protein FlgL
VATNVTLSSTARTNLLSIQNTAGLIGRTQDRLSTGLAIKSPIDDAVKYFQAKSLSDRAGDLSERKDGIDQGVSALEATLKATEGMEKLVKQMKGIVDGARSQSKSERIEAQNQLKELVSQVQRLVDDASYKGLNLLNASTSTLSVRFSEKSDSKLDVNGVNLNASAFYLDSGGAQLGVSATAIAADIVSALGFSLQLNNYDLSKASVLAVFNSKADTVLKSLDRTITNLRSKASNIANNAAILRVRLDFTKEYVNVLQGGSDKLTLADLNEEGANILALQTRQQLGIQALSLAGQAEQSILRLVQ